MIAVAGIASLTLRRTPPLQGKGYAFAGRIPGFRAAVVQPSDAPPPSHSSAGKGPAPPRARIEAPLWRPPSQGRDTTMTDSKPITL
jgi:hypothetical protein